MDSGQIPQVQPLQPSASPAQVMPQVQDTTPGGRPMVQQVQVMPEKKKDVTGLIKTIVIVAVSLVAVTFIGLFIWMSMQYNDVQSNLDEAIAEAVKVAKDEQHEEDEKIFIEEEKKPYKSFAGPVDYGQLTFEYPKTWSVYVAADASSGGDFDAYFNPEQVDAVSKDTINALRVTIRNKSFESVAAEYQREMDKRDSELTVESVTIGDESAGVTTTANRYTGTIPGTNLSGFIVIFKIRDKTAILQTDSVLFESDFDRLLTTIVFNA